MNLSRRNFLKGLGIGATGAALGVNLTFDAPAVYGQDVSLGSAYYRTALGDFEITVIRDAVSTLGLGTLVANADAEQVNAVLSNANFPTGEQSNNFKQLLVNTGDALVLFDTGLGSENSQLIPTLEMIGVAPGDVTHVVISHWHPDHVGGVAPGGEIAFPNATYHMAQAEWDNINSNPDNQGFQGALATLQPLVDADVLVYFEDGAELLPGIEAVATPGHTAGHTGFLISSGGMRLLNTVDAIIHPVISTQRPEWFFGFDSDPEQAVETRRSLLDRAANEGLMMFGYHFPFPGIGVVAADEEDGRYRFTPLSY